MRIVCASIFAVAAMAFAPGGALSCQELPYYRDYVCQDRITVDVYVHDYYGVRPQPPISSQIFAGDRMKFRTYPEVSPAIYTSDNLDGDCSQYYTRIQQLPTIIKTSHDAENIYRQQCDPREGQPLLPSRLWRIE